MFDSDRNGLIPPPISFNPMPLPYFQEKPNAFRRGGKVHMREVIGPKFGKGGIIKKAGKALEKGVRTVTRHPGRVLPHALAIAGHAIAGPVGGTIGGAIGGGLSGRRNAAGHRNFISNVLRGAGQGGITSGVIGLGNMAAGHDFGAPIFGSTGMFGGSTPGISGPLSPVSTGETGGILGKIKALGNSVMGGFGGSGGNEDPNKSEEGLLSKLGIGSPLNLALLATAIGGTMGRKVKYPHEESIAKLPNEREAHQAQMNFRFPKQSRRRVLNPGDDGENEQIYFEDVNDPTEYYAEGGYVSGSTGGQDDDVRKNLEEGSFVVPASVVSAYGDFNSDAGAKKLYDLVHSIMEKHAKGGEIPESSENEEDSKKVPAYVSHGEFIVEKPAVDAWGVKKWESFVENVLNNAGIDRLPPKSKGIMHYLR